MTTSDPNPRPGQPEQAESLSATGMFLRAFESNSDSSQELREPDAKSVTAPFSSAGNTMPDRPTEPISPQRSATPSRPSPVQPVAQGSGPGEFTQMFQRLEPQQDPDSAARGFHEAPSRPVAETHPSSVKAGSPPSSDQGPGEFTRIFVAGLTPPAAAPSKNAEEVPRPTPPVASPPRAKGFSSPGTSDSASAEGSFTQFFKAPTPAAASKPAVPAQSSSPFAPSSPPPRQEIPWKDEPIFKPSEKSPSSVQPSPSATNLLESLSAAGSPSGSRQQEPAPYRPEPLPSYAAPSRPQEPSRMDGGGVTQFIERLAQETPQAAAPPVTPASPAASSGPGEFTRMISSLGAQSAAPAPAQPVAAQPAAPPAAPFTPAAPPPKPTFAPPPVHAPIMPPAPKPAVPPPPALPAIAAPKSKLDAMVPILLVVNTFLLIVILVVLIFSIKR